MKRLRVTVENQTYEVLVESVEKLDQEPAVNSVEDSRPESSASSRTIEVTSPLSASVVAIKVALGDKVNAGDEVLTLEAMKMNSVVNAVAAGIVSEIKVQPGDTVNEGDLLITIASA